MSWRIEIGDALERLRAMPDESVHAIVTSPPYFGLRSYAAAGQIGLEATPSGYVEALAAVFDEARRVLRADGIAFVNLGDTYVSRRPGSIGSNSTINGSRTQEAHHEARRAQPRQCYEGLAFKQLLGMPWRVAFELQARGWWLRQDIIWHKPNPMPESVRDRCTKAHEYVFLLARSEHYHFDVEAIAERAVRPEGPGSVSPNSAPPEHVANGSNVRSGLHRIGARATRNRRSVWSIPPAQSDDDHFAVMPEKLAELCVLAGSPVDGVVLDPFTGSGTTGAVAVRYGRSFVGIELNPEYAAMARERIAAAEREFAAPLFDRTEAACG